MTTPLATATPIYDALVTEAWVKMLPRGKRISAAKVKRAAQIREGSCPPWRTDVTIPPGYEGAP